MLENAKLSELYIQRVGRERSINNIYCGFVRDILPGMEAAFVDIGLERNAFLFVKEVVCDDITFKNSSRIEHLLKKGQELVVQVTKEPMGSKGARLTSQVTIPGRYIVFAPTASGVGYSKKLSEDEIAELEPKINKIRSDEYGLIVRTAAREADLPALKRDLKCLQAIWKEICERPETKQPVLLYNDNDIVLKVVRDVFTEGFHSLMVDDKETLKRVQKYLKSVHPTLAGRSSLYSGTIPLFEHLSLENEIQGLSKRKVWLRSGGHITFDRTEALTAIDVNTGKYVGRSSLEDTIFKTNLEAADELVRQLRLRDIGGIIIVDFIDMLSESHRTEVLHRLETRLAEDKARSRVSGWTDFGLIQITRKSVSEGISGVMMEACSRCDGYGRQLSLHSRAKMAYQTVVTALARSANESFIFGVSVEIYSEFREHPGALFELKRKLGKRVYFVRNEDSDEECFLISSGKDKAIKKEIDLLDLNLLN